MSSATNTFDFDLSVFKEEDKSHSDSKCKEISQCPSISRLLASLKYYQMLNIIENDQHRDFFIGFMKDIYYQLLDDNIHLIMVHNDKLREIR
eukprot:73585_1